MNSQAKIIKNTTYLTSAFIGQKLLAFIYFVLIARLIGVENVGKYTVALSYTTIFSIFIDLGTSPIITREVAKQKDKLHNYLNTIISSKLILSLLVYLVVIISIHILNYDTQIRKLIYVSGFVMIADSFVLSIYSSLRGLQNLKYEALGIILNQCIAMSIGVTGLLFFTKNPIILMFAFLFGSIANGLFAKYSLQKNYSLRIKINFDWPTIKHIYIISIPFALSGIFTRVYSYIDSIILQRYMGDAAVGIYSVAYKIPFALQFIPSAFAASIYPAMSAFYNKEPKKLQQTWEKATIYLLLLALPMLWGIYQLSDIVILNFYGNEYAESVTVLKTLIFGLIFIFLNFPLGSLLAACDKQNINTTFIGLTMVINIIANIILIPRFSYLGAAYAFLISHGFLFISSFIYAHWLISINKLNLSWIFIRLLLATYIMGIFVSYVKSEISWVLSIFVGATIYGLAILMLKVLNTKEFLAMLKRK